MNAAINISTEVVLTDLENKQTEPSTTAKAEIWYPKAVRVMKLSESMVEFLRLLQLELKTKAGFPKKGVSRFEEDNKEAVAIFAKSYADQLYDKMIGYKKNLMEIDPKINAEFRNNIVLFQSKFDKDQNTKSGFSKLFFEGLTAGECLAVLNHFENNISLIANKMIFFCNEMAGSVHSPEYYFSALISQSSTTIRKGERIEITAGIGAYSKSAAPKVTIDGIKTEMNEDGSFIRMLPIAQAAGKHQARVIIDFKDQEGNVQKIEKKVEYMVVD